MSAKSLTTRSHKPNYAKKRTQVSEFEIHLLRDTYFGCYAS